MHLMRLKELCRQVLHLHPAARWSYTFTSHIHKRSHQLLPYHFPGNIAFESQYQFHTRLYKKNRERVLIRVLA